MRTGIICEFNPFHKGHKHLIDEVKKTDSSVICCMSGNFVQRGEFAVYDKFTRAKTALENGADLVIELGAECSTLSAEGFAKSAVKLLEGTGVVDQIAFGAENNNVEELAKVAKMLNDDSVKAQIKSEMKNGVSYPVARKNVLKTDLLNTPNNILAVEYLRFMTAKPFAVKRIGEGHDTNDINYSSSAIRSTLELGEISSIYNCEKAVLAKLRCFNANDFAKIADVNDGLENRLCDAVKNATTLNELYGLVNTKRYTMSRIKRIVLRSYLGIEGTNAEMPYIRVLGFNGKGKELLKEIKAKSNLPIVTRPADCNEANIDYFNRECRYTDLYNLGYEKALPCGTEQRSQIVII